MLNFMPTVYFNVNKLILFLDTAQLLRAYVFFSISCFSTVTCLLDKDGGLMNSYTVEPFGKNINYEETIHNPFTFIGQWGVMKFEDVEELYYMRARFYDAQHGRFLSADPLGMAGKSPNFYVYAYNNPVHYNDPKGTFVPLVLGTLNVAMYAGVQYLTGGDITLGGKTFPQFWHTDSKIYSCAKWSFKMLNEVSRESLRS